MTSLVGVVAGGCGHRWVWSHVGVVTGAIRGVNTSATQQCSSSRPDLSVAALRQHELLLDEAARWRSGISPAASCSLSPTFVQQRRRVKPESVSVASITELQPS
ncbi:unnamed protein product [Pleuronectes platessa]|uniref:Uncharacterized protein n=1 Tax=Pleuronectes platessa TaxID=8262 RepID=A0A9N7YWS8_PLEPL|nr:unnamed protein product [Pleuronectes platessa]